MWHAMQLLQSTMVTDKVSGGKLLDFVDVEASHLQCYWYFQLT